VQPNSAQPRRRDRSLGSRSVGRAFPAYIALYVGERRFHFPEKPTGLGEDVGRPFSLELANKFLMPLDP
jgi:hypothetical protein